MLPPRERRRPVRLFTTPQATFPRIDECGWRRLHSCRPGRRRPRTMNTTLSLLLLCSAMPANLFAEVTYPPALPGGKEIVTVSSEEFLKPPATILPGVLIAKTPPAIDL